MTTPPISKGTPDVPTRVFEKFLEALDEASASTDLVARLRKTLLEDKKFTERALKEAVLAEEPLP
jgi:tripartite-type tricarboxylate transporter receptor subunit TctC